MPQILIENLIKSVIGSLVLLDLFTSGTLAVMGGVTTIRYRMFQALGRASAKFWNFKSRVGL